MRSFNKLAPGVFSRGKGLFDFAPISKLENHLAFVRTNQGQHYYLGDPGYIAVYKPEPDIYGPGGYFFVIGRHLLFRVLNPTETVRLRLSLTDSILGEGRTLLPSAAVVQGAASAPVGLGLVGSGSANVYSAPLQPFVVNGASYVALDLGRATLPIGRPATGLQAMYNRNLSLDTRAGVGYCRDSSLVSEERYRSRPVRRSLSRFPADLTGTEAVEYSGIYEDGWLSRQAFVMLGPVDRGAKVTVSAMRPLIPGKKPGPQRVTLLADGVPLLSQILPPGSFTLEAPLRASSRQVRIELRFESEETLPAPDFRPVTVLLESITITSTP